MVQARQQRFAVWSIGGTLQERGKKLVMDRRVNRLLNLQSHEAEVFGLGVDIGSGDSLDDASIEPGGRGDPHGQAPIIGVDALTRHSRLPLGLWLGGS